MNPKAWLVAAAMLVAGTAQATCYTVYKADGSVLQQSSTTPVDLTLLIGDSVTEKFGPGATMTVSDQGIYCRDAKERQQQAQKSLADAIMEGDKKPEPAIKRVANAMDETKTAAK